MVGQWVLQVNQCSIQLFDKSHQVPTVENSHWKQTGVKCSTSPCFRSCPGCLQPSELHPGLKKIMLWVSKNWTVDNGQQTTVGSFNLIMIVREQNRSRKRLGSPHTSWQVRLIQWWQETGSPCTKTPWKAVLSLVLYLSLSSYLSWSVFRWSGNVLPSLLI